MSYMSDLVLLFRIWIRSWPNIPRSGSTFPQHCRLMIRYRYTIYIPDFFLFFRIFIAFLPSFFLLKFVEVVSSLYLFIYLNLFITFCSNTSLLSLSYLASAHISLSLLTECRYNINYRGLTYRTGLSGCSTSFTKPFKFVGFWYMHGFYLQIIVYKSFITVCQGLCILCTILTSYFCDEHKKFSTIH
jgi:hypothetical protein